MAQRFRIGNTDPGRPKIRLPKNEKNNFRIWRAWTSFEGFKKTYKFLYTFVIKNLCLDPDLDPDCFRIQQQPWSGPEEFVEEHRFLHSGNCLGSGRYINFVFVVRIQRGDGGVQEYLLHCVGCGRAGQDQVKNIWIFHTEAEVLKLTQNINSYLGSFKVCCIGTYFL